MSIEEFGRLPDGSFVSALTLANSSGMSMRVISYGGIIVSLRTPDRQGNIADVVLGYDALEPYLTDPFYLGAIIGRYGNRIANGQFAVDGFEYQLAKNDAPNHLHGGNQGFDKRNWTMDSLVTPDGDGVVLERASGDGEEGYPGAMNVRVSYVLAETNLLIVTYQAITDRPTVVNLTQHTFFNLTGDPARDITGHEVQIYADRYTPVDDSLIPTGQLAPVDGTPLDLRMPTVLASRLGSDHRQVELGHGIDHNFVLRPSETGKPVAAARVVEPESGRQLKVFTDQPGIQLYTGNFLDGTRTGKQGVPLGHRTGFCLETQHYPDSPNQAAFPSTVLTPGEVYLSTTVFRFSTVED